MLLKIRKSKDNVWGFPESFSVYNYEGVGYIKILGVITPMGTLAQPYVFRAETFIPASVIEEEMGIEKYLKAKKPFYCLLSDGFIAEIRTGVDFVNNKYLPEKSSFNIYMVARSSEASINDGAIQLINVLEIPEKVTLLMSRISEGIAASGGDRATFLRSRMVSSEE